MTHFRKLERMYLDANVNTIHFEKLNIEISKGYCEISMPIKSNYFHSLGAIHGSVYFKLLDDAAFFAVNSLVEDCFVLTTSFSINFLKPVSKGILKAQGKIRFESKNLFVAEALLLNEKNEEVAIGTGNFTRSKILLSENIGYL